MPTDATASRSSLLRVLGSASPWSSLLLVTIAIMPLVAVVTTLVLQARALAALQLDVQRHQTAVTEAAAALKAHTDTEESRLRELESTVYSVELKAARPPGLVLETWQRSLNTELRKRLEALERWRVQQMAQDNR